MDVGGMGRLEIQSFRPREYRFWDFVLAQRELTGLGLNARRQFLNIVPEDVAWLSCQNKGHC